MSLTDENEQNTSDSTLEAGEFEKVLLTLELAAADARESGDYLSYSTVLDICASDPTGFSNAEKEQILSHILGALTTDKEMTAEIGWDLPALLISYIDSDYDFVGPVRKAPGVYKVLKIFEVLAIEGNSKELFLKSTELLSTIKITDSPTENQENAEKFYDLKVYCLFELINSCLRRIHTLYPSKFLAMTMTSFINSIYINKVRYSNDFLWKRLYTFARNYTRPPLPDSTDLPAEELARINEDEDYLQRKLLTAFLTEAINRFLVLETVGFAVDFFNYLQRMLPANAKYTNNFQLDMPVFDRLYELALSFDLDLTSSFRDFMKSSSELIDSIAYTQDSEDDATAKLVELVVTDYQNNFCSSLISSEATAITDSLGGTLNLFTYSIGHFKVFDKVDVSIKLAVDMAIRLIVPGIVHSNFIYRGQHDVAIFWCWYAVHMSLKNGRDPTSEVGAIPKVVLMSFFQALLFATVSCSSNLYFRYVTLTLLTRFLSLASEDVSFNFIVNTLRECPYQNVKAAIVGVLKELSIKDKVIMDDLAESMSHAKISKEDSKNKCDSIPPPLPSRQNKAGVKYINLTEQRVNDVFALIDMCMSEAFTDGETGPYLNGQILPTLQAYLNFLFLVRNEKFIKGQRYQDVVDKVQKHIKGVEENAGDETSSSLGGIGILKVTVERLTL